VPGGKSGLPKFIADLRATGAAVRNTPQTLQNAAHDRRL